MKPKKINSNVLMSNLVFCELNSLKRDYTEDIELVDAVEIYMAAYSKLEECLIRRNLLNL